MNKVLLMYGIRIRIRNYISGVYKIEQNKNVYNAAVSNPRYAEIIRP